jgi:hypothetical protein
VENDVVVLEKSLVDAKFINNHPVCRKKKRVLHGSMTERGKV